MWFLNFCHFSSKRFSCEWYKNYNYSIWWYIHQKPMSFQFLHVKYIFVYLLISGFYKLKNYYYKYYPIYAFNVIVFLILIIIFIYMRYVYIQPFWIYQEQVVWLCNLATNQRGLYCTCIPIQLAVKDHWVNLVTMWLSHSFFFVKRFFFFLQNIIVLNHVRSQQSRLCIWLSVNSAISHWNDRF